MAKTKSEPFLPYLRYATLADVRKEAWETLWVWFVVSVLFSAVSYAIEAYSPLSDFKPDWKSPLPTWLTIAIVIAFVSWYLRGKRFPMLSFKAWLAGSLYVTALLFMIEHLPLWLMWPFVWGGQMFVDLLDTLNGLGKDNFEAVKTSR